MTGALRVLATLVVFLACFPVLAETVLHRGNRSEPAALDPHKINTRYELNIVEDLFEGLTAFDAAANPVPGVAASWDVSEDGRIYTFYLRENLMWSDGEPITSDDVVFSFRRFMNPETAALYAQLFYLVQNGREVNTGALPMEDLAVTAPDEATVVFELTGPAPYFPEMLANGFAGIVPRHAVERFDDDWSAPGQMVSNGAYTLEAWSPQDRIALLRNERFHDAENVQIDRIYYYPTDDTVSGVARFRAGDLDMQLEFAPEQAKPLRALLGDEVHLIPSLTTFYLTVNTTLPHLSDPRVRRALSMAIDRKIITERVRGVGEPPALSFVPPQIANYEPAIATFASMSMEARRKEAKRLLAEAGYGPDNPLEVSYVFSGSNENRRLAVVIAAMWKLVGVETALLNREGKIHFSSLRAGDFEIGYVGWGADYNDASTFLYVLQSESVNVNYARYNNPAYDTLSKEAVLLADLETRADMMRRAEAMMLHDQPIIPIFFSVTKQLVKDYVKGWVDNAPGSHLSRYLRIEK